MHIPKAESGLSKQLLSNLQADRQVEAEVKNRVAYKQVVLFKKPMFNLFLTF